MKIQELNNVIYWTWNNGQSFIHWWGFSVVASCNVVVSVQTDFFSSSWMFPFQRQGCPFHTVMTHTLHLHSAWHQSMCKHPHSTWLVARTAYRTDTGDMGCHRTEQDRRSDWDAGEALIIPNFSYGFILMSEGILLRCWHNGNHVYYEDVLTFWFDKK